MKAITLKVTIVCQGFDQSSILLQPWRRVYEISRRMIARGISVTVITDGELVQSRQEEIERIQIDRVSNLVIAPVTKKKKLLQTILRNKPDVVVWFGTPLSAVYLNKLKSIAIPFIWDIDSDLHSLRILRRISIRESLHPHHTRALLDPLLTALCPRFVMRSAANSHFVSKIVVPSQYLKDSLVRIGVERDKIAVVPSTIETNSEEYACACPMEELREKLGYEPEEFVFTYYGSPCSLRGPDTAILSLPRILRRIRNARLIILSRRERKDWNSAAKHSEAEEKYLESLVRRLRLDDHVNIVSGILDRSSLLEYIEASNAVVLPFKLVFSEPPLSVLEAMRLGKVIVSTNLNVLNEIVRNDRGILVEPNRPEALAKAILFLAEHQGKARSYSINAQQYASRLPDWEATADQFVGLLDEVLNGIRGKPD